MSTCSEEKRKLIETIGLHFEREHEVSPLAARIFGLLVLSPADSFTFDEIMELTCASKSSVSTNINLLIQLKSIEYFTKPGDRKRYFRVSKNHLRISLEETLLKVKRNLEIISLIERFNCQYEKEKSHKSIVRNYYKEYLINQQENLNTTIQKIAELQNQ